MKNQVIEVLNKEHGKKVIEYWKSKGVDTRYKVGICTKKDDSKFRYYGVIYGRFNFYSERQVADNNAEIIHLTTESPNEENSFPRVMLVSDDGNIWYRRVVFMKKFDIFLSWVNAETLEESKAVYSTTVWRYAKELPEKVELTKSEIVEKFGLSVDQLVIKDD